MTEGTSPGDRSCCWCVMSRDEESIGQAVVAGQSPEYLTPLHTVPSSHARGQKKHPSAEGVLWDPGLRLGQREGTREHRKSEPPRPRPRASAQGSSGRHAHGRGSPRGRRQCDSSPCCV